MMEAVRWAMLETLRVFWTGDRDAAAKAINEMLRFDVPCVGKFEDVIVVQRTDLKSEEEILVLLHYAGSRGSRGRNSANTRCARPRTLPRRSTPSRRRNAAR